MGKCVWVCVCEKASSDCSREKDDHNYARLWPAGSWPTVLLPWNAARVGGLVWGGGSFSIHFLSLPHRERKHGADVWETECWSCWTGGGFPSKIKRPKVWIFTGKGKFYNTHHRTATHTISQDNDNQLVWSLHWLNTNVRRRKVVYWYTKHWLKSVYDDALTHLFK